MIRELKRDELIKEIKSTCTRVYAQEIGEERATFKIISSIKRNICGVAMVCGNCRGDGIVAKIDFRIDFSEEVECEDCKGAGVIARE
jgi:DnaJ-class molecular chaperone